MDPHLSSAAAAPRYGDRHPSLRGAARFLHPASSQRLLREPSMVVRETAAEQLEERQTMGLLEARRVSRCLVELGVRRHRRWSSRREQGREADHAAEAVDCGTRFSVGATWYVSVSSIGGGGRRGKGWRWEFGAGSSRFERGGAGYGSELNREEVGTSVAKHLESANTMFSFIWWIIGFYWVSVGGAVLTHDAPQLYWLCIVFLAFDVFFVVFCVALACVIGIAVCCCLPCIIAILYAVADQEGASDEDIRQLPKYKFWRTGDSEKLGSEMSRSSSGIMTECGSDPLVEHALSAEDS
ncbi:uncharacterized protein A4U43_C01F17360, partial [Asparagus officinalis]